MPEFKSLWERINTKSVYTETQIPFKIRITAFLVSPVSSTNLPIKSYFTLFNEKKFAELLDTDGKVAVYVKLPDGFYISTPVGHYNPDWDYL